MSSKVSLTPDEAVDLAARHMQQGNFIESRRICDMIVASVPQHSAALNVLGALCLHENNYDQAISFLEKSLDANDQVAGVWGNLGYAYLQKANIEKAIPALSTTLKLNPDHDIARSQLVDCYVKDGLYNDALRVVKEKLDVEPDNVSALILLERVSLEMGRYNVAHSTFKKLLTLLPDNDVEIKLEIAQVFLASNFPGRAKKLIEDVLKCDPDNKRALWLYGDMFQQSGMLDKGITYMERAIEGGDIPMQTQMALASSYTDLNRKEDALAILNAILDQHPDSIQALSMLSHVQDKGLSPDQIETVKSVQMKFPDDALIQENTAYALAHTAEAAKDYITAFHHLRIANKYHKTALEKQGRGYHQKGTEKRFQLIKDVFTPDLIARLSKFGNPSLKPVFIAGMPRSGTTLTEQIIGNHSKAAGVGELMDLPHLGILIREFANVKKDYPECLPDLDEKYIPHLANGYLNRLSDWEPKADRIVNKLPGNFLYLGLIRILFPNAAIIHCVRDPRDTLISCFFARFNAGLGYSFDLDDCAHQYGLYSDLMDYWDSIFPNSIYQSFYGDLVSKPEQSVEKLLSHLGLDWEENCLNFYKADKSVRTASRMQVRKPIYTSSLERWRRYEGSIDEIQHLTLPKRFQTDD